MIHVRVEAARNIKIVMGGKRTLPELGVFSMKLKITNEVKRMELVEINHELENIMARIADFRGSL